MQDLALTPNQRTTENTWSFLNSPMPEGTHVPFAAPHPQALEPRTPKRIGGFAPTSSPLFVAPESERVVEVKAEVPLVIDLTDD